MSQRCNKKLKKWTRSGWLTFWSTYGEVTSISRAIFNLIPSLIWQSSYCLIKIYISNWHYLFILIFFIIKKIYVYIFKCFHWYVIFLTDTITTYYWMFLSNILILFFLKLKPSNLCIFIFNSYYYNISVFYFFF